MPPEALSTLRKPSQWLCGSCKRDAREIPPGEHPVEARIALTNFEADQAAYFPAVEQRLYNFIADYMPEYEPGEYTRSLLARTIAKDPSLRLYVSISGDDVTGFAVAELQGFGSRVWVWSLAGTMDPVPENRGILARYFLELEDWGRQNKAVAILHGTERPETVWVEKHRFTHRRAIMSRPIS